MSATSATSAMAATPHGSAEEKLRWSADAAAPDPTAVPHRWQNFAPGVSAAPHAAQVAPPNDAPQFGQNLLPCGARVWHDGHVTVGPVGDG
jgi:hypothetical protein